jgi:serine O-acetyltransferase
MNIPVKQTRVLLRSLMEALHDVFFPEYGLLSYDESLSNAMDALSQLCPPEVTEAFRTRISAIGKLLKEDVEAIAANDPAAESVQEIIYCYPAITAMLHYRVAHELDALGVGIIPRMLTEWAHANTGIDIHPQATIGHHFAIDHGTGLVIGQTAIIGNYVTIYQGVTIGAKNIRKAEDGSPCNIPRHPIIEDGVTIYSNATLLGRITVGEGSVIGGNVWLTHSVPPHSRIIQQQG